MTYSINREEIKKIGDQLGLKVHFDSNTPGVKDFATGEIKDFIEFFDEDFFNIEEYDTLGSVEFGSDPYKKPTTLSYQINIKKITSKNQQISFEEICA